jgi:hypothetical protein
MASGIPASARKAVHIACNVVEVTQSHVAFDHCVVRDRRFAVSKSGGDRASYLKENDDSGPSNRELLNGALTLRKLWDIGGFEED